MSLTLPALTGISISGSMQNTVSGSALQGSVNRVQVTVNSSRIQSSSARVHATGGRLQPPGRIVAAVSIRPKAVTPTVYPHADPAKIKSIADLAGVNNKNLSYSSYRGDPSPLEVAGNTNDWIAGGALVAGIVACGVGAAFTLGAAAAACVIYGGIGATYGAWLGGLTGFTLSFNKSKGADAFDWGPDQLVTPWSY